MNQIASSVLVGLGQGARADSMARSADPALRQLREEWQAQQALFQAQPVSVQGILQAQAAQIAEALVGRQGRVQFMLPEQLVLQSPGRNGDNAILVPPEFRKQVVAGLLGGLLSRDIRTAVRQRLASLEQSHHRAVAVAARLVRYATVTHMVHDMLPAGEPVAHVAAEDELIPATPSVDVEPTTSIAPRFYMPQWVAFDNGRLLVNSIDEAEARVAAMQGYLSTLHLAVSLAPYIFADEEYQRKRYGMLGQLVHQGRALACYQIGVVIGKIQRRAEANALNRGLSLSLPYFDDQMLEMKMYDFDVIPSGRTLFVPAFVVLAVRREQIRVAQDMRLSESTRMHLLSGLKTLERAFDISEL